jgi:putative ABC transport system substrate-binding protein
MLRGISARFGRRSKMRRRDILSLICGTAGWVAVPSIVARAQQRIPRIGVLLIGAPVAPKDLALASELGRLGHVGGRSIAYEIRAADGDLSRLSRLAQELVATTPDVLVAATSVAAEALAAATSRIPIVMTVTIDPIATGLTASMARPTRNVTGFTSSSPTLAAKRLELLHEFIPGLQKVAYLTMPAGPVAELFEKQVRGAASALGVTMFSVPVSTESEVSGAFAILDREKVQAVMVEINPTNVRVGPHIIDECLVRDLPSVHPWFFEVRAGALMSYGPAKLENHAGVARYVDRILKGAKIAELPFEEPTEIKLGINLRTARSIKVAIPNTLLVRADEVIE